MYRSLSSLVPNAADLLGLEVEELAGVLLMHLNSYEGVSGNTVYQHGGISHHNFFNSLTPTNARDTPEYGDKQLQVNLALKEAWAWLQSAGLLVEKASSTGGWFFISRRAKQLRSLDDFAAYRKAALLPKTQLHALIASKVYPAFLRGEYDTAVFQAFREVEVAVRDAGKFGPNDYGTDLMRAAFRPRGQKQPANRARPAHGCAVTDRGTGGNGPISSPARSAFTRIPKATATSRRMRRTRPRSSFSRASFCGSSIA
ncbi:MAG: hypothetical protein IT165_01695 [Bryobacterales bacterium]|nr:hypothetical protein [Bryobacterales bacterium]